MGPRTSLVARWSRVLLGLAVGLGGAACGDITAFCLSAGAPDGVTLVVTTTPTPDGFRIDCHAAPADTSRPVAAGRGFDSAGAEVLHAAPLPTQP